MLYVFNITFKNEETGAKKHDTVPIPNTREGCEEFEKWLYSHYPEFTHAEYITDELVSGNFRARIHDLKTREVKMVTIDPYK